jgi:hypothetical protein
MKAWNTPILVLVLLTGIHSGLSWQWSPSERAARPYVAPLRANLDLALIDDFLGMKQSIVYPVTVSGYSSTRDQCDSEARNAKD